MLQLGKGVECEIPQRHLVMGETPVFTALLYLAQCSQLWYN